MDFLKRVGLILLIAIGVSAGLYLLARTSTPASLVGQRAKNIEFFTLDGQRKSLSQLHSQPVLINFWRGDCPPCLQELPSMEQFATDHPELTVWLVCLDSSRDQIEDTVETALRGTTFDHAEIRYCGEDRLNLKQLYKDYAITGIPRTLLVDGNGIIQADLLGARSASELQQELVKAGLLKE